MLEENLKTFMKNELQKFQMILSSEYSEALENQEKEDERNAADQEQAKGSRETFLKLSLLFLRRMRKDDLADCLWNSKRFLTDLVSRLHHSHMLFQI